MTKTRASYPPSYPSGRIVAAMETSPWFWIGYIAALIAAIPAGIYVGNVLYRRYWADDHE